MATSSDLEKSINRIGLTEIHTPIAGGDVDIIFIHGLGGHPYFTWTSTTNKVFWPGVLLLPVLEKKARIAGLTTALVWNYFLKKDLSTAFGVATWVLVAGTLLAGTFKALLGDRPRPRLHSGIDH
ncbi:Serine active site containing protein 1 [Mycoblastus sanguinarius]|nr:Serine active site containing protein 1 [Mycoblastus sanguinarius]